MNVDGMKKMCFCACIRRGSVQYIGNIGKMLDKHCY
jgi:hypothetical protein